MSLISHNAVGYFDASGKQISKKEYDELTQQKTINDVASSKDEAMRFDGDKLRFDLIPIEALIELARVYSMGALKYNDDNWRKGMPWRKCVRPIFSHLLKWLSGQAIDSETGCHHLSMVAWNVITLLVYDIRKLGTDDRNKFAITENFDWEDNHLSIGLDDAKITELKNKYKKFK